MERPILNLDEVELVEQAAGERFRGWLGAIGGRIGAPAGGPETAHQIVNTSDGDCAMPCRCRRPPMHLASRAQVS